METTFGQERAAREPKRKRKQHCVDDCGKSREDAHRGQDSEESEYEGGYAQKC